MVHLILVIYSSMVFGVAAAAACMYPPSRLHLVLIACIYLLLTVLGSSFVWRALS